MTDTQILENTKKHMQKFIESTRMKNAAQTLKVTGVISQTLKKVTLNNELIIGL